jgi:hypothetical protein
LVTSVRGIGFEPTISASAGLGVIGFMNAALGLRVVFFFPLVAIWSPLKDGRLVSCEKAREWRRANSYVHASLTLHVTGTVCFDYLTQLAGRILRPWIFFLS